MRWMTRPFAVMGVAALAAGTLAACGDDDDGDAADDSETVEVSEEFCQARLDIEAAFNEEDSDAIQAAVADLQASAPESIADDVDIVADTIAQDPELLFEDEGAGAAVASIDEVVVDSCGFAVVDVTAGDYVFEGIPADLDAGTTAFRFTNEGNELHELAIAALPEDLDEPLLDYVERAFELFEQGDEEAADELLSFVAFAFAPPGGTDVAIGELEPGEYVALCFIPVGAVTEEDFETAEGPPHFQEGMYFEFTVS